MGNGGSELRAAVVGVGHLGRQHARIYAGLPGVRLVAVVDADPARAAEVAAQWGARAVADHRELPGLVDLASVATPTRHHHAVAMDLLAGGLHLLVEKPITRTVDEARELVEQSRSRNLRLAVGHVERFNPALVAVQKHVVRPRYLECHRISPYPFRSADVGVVLDLMIHDIDIILHLVDAPLERVDAVGVNVLSRSEDVANARLEFTGGCVASVTASRVSLKRERKIRIFQEDAYVTLDFDARKGQIFRRAPGFDPAAVPDIASMDPAQVAQLDDRVRYVLENFIQAEEISMDEDYEPLARELGSFVEAVRGGRDPVVSGEHGLRALAAAEAIQQGIARSRERMG